MSASVSERATHVPHGLVEYNQMPAPERTLSAEDIAALEREHRYFKGRVTEQGEVFTFDGTVVPEDDPVMVYESPLNAELIKDLEDEAPQYVRIEGIDPPTGPLATIADKSYDREHYTLLTNTALLAHSGLQRALEAGKEVRAASRRATTRLGRISTERLIETDESFSHEQS